MVRGRRQPLTLVGVAALVVVTDQVSKWLAWRHLGTAVINEGGFVALGSAREWFAQPVPGAVTDAVGLLLVGIGVAWLLLRRHSAAVLLGGALVAAGWLSNLLDRVALHGWTAPGSGRGVVDFVPTGGATRWNVADGWITVGLLLLLYGAIRASGRRARRRSGSAPHPHNASQEAGQRRYPAERAG